MTYSDELRREAGKLESREVGKSGSGFQLMKTENDVVYCVGPSAGKYSYAITQALKEQKFRAGVFTLSIRTQA